MLYLLLAIVALCAVISLAVDLGRLQHVKTELQQAADAAVRFAVTGLGDGSHIDKAIDAANDNTAYGTPVLLQTGDIETGNWNQATRTFTVGGTPGNAVRVTARRVAARGNAVPLLFAGVIGVRTADVSATAIAVQTPGSSNALVGLERIELNSNISTDSYLSAAGPYSPSTAGTSGSLVSNGSITLNTTTVRRDVYMRAGRSLVSNNSTYGTRINMPSAFTMTTPSAGSFSTTNDNSRIRPIGVVSGTTLLVNSGTLTIPAGNYYFTSISVSSGTVNVTGAATIHLNGNALFNSLTFHVAGNNPANLTFKVVHTGSPSFAMNSIQNVWADIQAPTAHVELNSINENFYGRIIGRSIRANSNTKFHIDQSLPPLGGASTIGGATSGKITVVR